MPDDNDDIQILVDDLDRFIIRQNVEEGLRKIEDSLNKTNTKLDSLQKSMNDAISKEKLKASRNNRCLDPNLTCIVIGPDDTFDSATEEADSLTEQLKNGEISPEQYLSEMKSILDDLPLDERQRFGMFLEQDRFIDAFSSIKDISSLIPGFHQVEKIFNNSQLLLTYFQSYAVGGNEAALRSVIQVLSENGLEYVIAGGIVIPFAISAGFTLGPALLLGVILPKGILDLLKRNDEKSINNDNYEN